VTLRTWLFLKSGGLPYGSQDIHVEQAGNLLRVTLPTMQRVIRIGAWTVGK